MGIIFPGRKRHRATGGYGHRKRRVATPGFGHTPHDPIGGGYANLRAEGVHPYCAMMQVAAADEYEDYVICRGFDTRILKFVDYEEDNDDKPGISVAKPFGNRVQDYYEIGQIFPAFLPTQGSVSEGPAQGQNYVPPSPTDIDWRVGQNPGTTGGTTGGHPDDLDDAISELTDHNGKYVNWILIDSGNVIKWGRCQGKPTGGNGTTAGSKTVSVKACDYDATDDSSETGDAFDITTPVRGASKDTALFVGSVVGYVQQGDDKIIVTEFTDAPIGTVKMVNVDAAIRIGWQECVSGATLDMAGRIPIGVDTGAGVGKWIAIDEDGGAETHGPGVTPTGHDTTSGKGHADHDHSGQNWDHSLDTGSGYASGSDGATPAHPSLGPHEHDTHDAANHMPPWRAVKFIERFE